MTAAALDALAGIRSEWLLAESFWDAAPDQFDTRLGALVGDLISVNPEGGLSRLTVLQVRRRLHLALVTSLLRVVSEPSQFYTRFGTVPQALADMLQHRPRFSQAMAFFWRQTPYAALVASQTFWRTLQTLDLETGRPSGATRSRGG